MYDYLVVGTGLFGSVFARQVAGAGRSVVLIDRRPHLGGNVYSEAKGGVHVHRYGPHIFHTNDRGVWDYVNRFAAFNNYTHRPKAVYQGEVYSLPFNLMTFYHLWGCRTPAEAMAEMKRQRVPIARPANLEEWALSQVGPDVYQKLIYGYTKKQWRRDPRRLPASILKRIPVRFTFDDNYFDDRYQGVPVDGYGVLAANLVDGLEVRLGEDFFSLPDWRRVARKLVYSGPVDRLCGYEFGDLEYLTLEFRSEEVEGDFQGTATVNYTEEAVPYTRVTEHKHFSNPSARTSVVTYEYPVEWGRDRTPFYPVNDEANNILYEKYKAATATMGDVIVGGRLGRFRYYNMDQVVASALAAANKELGQGAAETK